MAPSAHRVIAAFASLHTSIMFTAAIAAQVSRIGRPVRIALWALVALTTTATVYLGWHYVADDLAGVVIALVALGLARALTGFQPHMALRPIRWRPGRATGRRGDDERERRRVTAHAPATAPRDDPRVLRSAKPGAPRARSERTLTWWALGGCVLLALALRAPYLSIPLGRDEGGLSYMAQHWLEGGGQLYGPYWVDRPPLMFLLFKLAVLGGQAGVAPWGRYSQWRS